MWYIMVYMVYYYYTIYHINSSVLYTHRPESSKKLRSRLSCLLVHCKVRRAAVCYPRCTRSVAVTRTLSDDHFSGLRLFYFYAYLLLLLALRAFTLLYSVAVLYSTLAGARGVPVERCKITFEFLEFTLLYCVVLLYFILLGALGASVERCW